MVGGWSDFELVYVVYLVIIRFKVALVYYIFVEILDKDGWAGELNISTITKFVYLMCPSFRPPSPNIPFGDFV